MTVAEKPTRATTARRPGTRAGYVVAIILNAAGLVVVNNLLAWDLLPFLTEQFTDVLPLINLSLVATIVINTAWLSYDAPWFGSLGQVVMLGISMAATLRLYRVFPFDFTPSAFDWALLTRAALILALVGVGIAMVVEVVKLGTAVARGGGDAR